MILQILHLDIRSLVEPDWIGSLCGRLIVSQSSYGMMKQNMAKMDLEDDDSVSRATLETQQSTHRWRGVERSVVSRARRMRAATDG